VTDVRPFRALRYARSELSDVLVPPYDVITPDERERFWSGDPHHAIRLELTRDANAEAGTDYADVAAMLRDWQRDGVLARDASPALYGLAQRYRGPDGAERERRGFFAALGLAEYDERVVLPHERTMAGPKADRLKLLRATRANLSVIFLLYEDREGVVDAALAKDFDGPPVAQGADPAGTHNTLVRAADPQAVEPVRAFLAEQSVVIADGHHRYETALAYRRENPDDPAAAFTLAYFANAFSEGTLLLPIHRVILKGSAPAPDAWPRLLPEWSCTELEADDAQAIPELLERHLAPLGPAAAFVADDASGTLRLFRRNQDVPGELAIRTLHREVVGGAFGLDEDAVRDGAVAFPKHALLAARDVREGRGAVALYVNPLSPDDVFRVTRAGELLPQKSTLFQPKLPSGLLFRTLDEDPAFGTLEEDPA
jgi:uncharacterized protein (DUF1015 family)